MNNKEYSLIKVLNKFNDLSSSEILDALREDINLLKKSDSALHADYFNSLHSNFFNLLYERKFVDYIREWEQILFRIREISPDSFKMIHKGTPYYFCGVASFHVKDYERALFYFDAALIEDQKKSADWETLPAALFLKLDSKNENQFAQAITELVEDLSSKALEKYMESTKDSFNMKELKELFLFRSLKESSTWRSAATAFISFILEKESRRKEFKIRSADGGTMEPFFMHFFKGCLLFETLLKLSPRWRGDNRGTIETVIKDEVIIQLLEIDKGYKCGGLSFDQIVQKNKMWLLDEIRSNDRIIWTAYGIRNTTGHSLSWQTCLNVNDYMSLSDDILFSIFLVISKLYR